MMRLNLGCGNNKIPGWVNVDKIAACTPDQLVDLEKLPWPWDDNSVREVIVAHVLEHLGAATTTYLGIIKELYRICRDGARITIVAPHPRHDFFLADPTHVRPIIPEAFYLFSQNANRELIAKGFSNTPLGIYLGVDFSVDSVSTVLDEQWRVRYERKEITDAELEYAKRHYNNVVAQFQIVMHAVKSTGGTN